MRKKAVLVVGAGGLGVSAIIALAARGEFGLGLVDPERVELSNLPRQVIYGTRQLGAFKVDAAARYVKERFGFRKLNPMSVALDASNAPDLVLGHDFVIDATDDPAVKFLINDVCVAARRPFCHGGVLGFRGQAMTVMGGVTACLRCLFEVPPDPGETAGCRDAGIIGPVVGLIGLLQAKEAIAWLSGLKPRLLGKLFTYDGAGQARVRVLSVPARAGCVCETARGRLGRAKAGAQEGVFRLQA